MFTRLRNLYTIDTESVDADGTYYVARIVTDDNPDTSYLTQDWGNEDDNLMQRGRLESYESGQFVFTGVIVQAYDNNDAPLGEASLWGIESDSDPEYYREVAAELASEAYSK